MFLSNVKNTVIVLLVLGVIGSGVGLVAQSGEAKQPPSKPVPLPPLLPRPVEEKDVPLPRQPGREAEIKPRPAKTAEERATLLKDRVAAAEKAFRWEWAGLSQTRRFGNIIGSISQPENIYIWSVRWLHAERALRPKPADQVAALEAHFKRMAKLKVAVKQLSRDLMPAIKVDEAEWYLLEAELWLAEAKAKAKAK